MRVGFLHSLIRKDEKLLLDEFRKREGIELVMLDDRKLIFDLQSRPEVDIVLERCINHSRADSNAPTGNCCGGDFSMFKATLGDGIWCTVGGCWK